MGKKIFLTEEQLNIIIQEELGIAREVSKGSSELKNKLYSYIAEGDNEGEFNFLDIKIKYKVFNFKDIEEFYDWYDNHYKEVINGYSYNDKILYLSIIKIDGTHDAASLNDTIQHELEHYYQCKMAGKSFGKPVYGKVVNKMNDFNEYIKYLSIIEYYSNHIEIDACVNGAYFSVKDIKLKDYNSFIENSELKYIKEKLLKAYNFFSNIPFKGIFFDSMIIFIKENGLYKDCENVVKLRNKILDKWLYTYNYFIKKSSRAYALIKNEEEQISKSENDIFIKKSLKKGDS